MCRAPHWPGVSTPTWNGQARPIGRADPIVAAIAIRHDHVLVTGNQAHYQYIQALGYELKLANWRAAAS